MTRIAPDELDIKLMYRNAASLSSGASPLTYKAYHSNAAYDVDPAVASTETYGFDEYAALYSYYRVIGYSYEVSFVNLDTSQSVLVYVLNTNTNPSLAGTSFYLYSTNPHCQSKLLSNISPNMHTFRGKFTIAQIVGSPAPETADTFRATTSGLTTSLPSDLTWLTLAAEVIGSSTPTITVTYDLKLLMHVRFYARNVDLSLATMSARLNKAVLDRAEYNRSKLEKQDSKKKLFDKPTPPPAPF